MRFNHMELTFPTGSLTTEFREEIDAFYSSIFGWSALDTEVVGQSCHLLLPDPEQFILLAESDKPMSSPGYDHLGLLQESREEVDDLLDACERYAEKDGRVKIRRYEDLVYPGLTVHAFYVKYLLPIYFDVQSMERAEGRGLTTPWDGKRVLV
jgi:hypothetical protein